MNDEANNVNHNHSHANHGMTINGMSMDMSAINERVRLDVWERWCIRSAQGVHPFHVHGCSFLAKLGDANAIQSDQLMWKDTIIVDDKGWTEFIVRFDYPATEQYPYMYHCHILEHEDMGMMGQFTVS